MERLLLISSYPLHSISSQWPMFTAPWSAAPSDMFWDLTGSVGCVSTMDSDCLNRSCMMNFQRVQLLSEMHNLWDGRGFHVDSQNASGPSPGSLVYWCMYTCSIIQQLLLSPRGSQAIFSIAQAGLLWLTKHSVTFTPVCLSTLSQKNSPRFLWFQWRNFGR